MRMLAAWALYGIGDLACRTIVLRTFGHWFECPYRFYNWLMILSSRVQGDGRGPWK